MWLILSQANKQKPRSRRSEALTSETRHGETGGSLLTLEINQTEAFATFVVS